MPTRFLHPILPLVALVVFPLLAEAQQRPPQRPPQQRPSSSSSARRPAPPPAIAHPQLDLSLALAVPINEYAENTDGLGFGGRAAFHMPLGPRVPVYLGFHFGGFGFGVQRQFLNEEVVITAGNTIIGRIPINIEARTSNVMLNGMLGLRVQAPLKYVQPYVEALGGGNYFYTRTALFDRTNNGWLSDNEDNRINARNLSSSFTYTFGGGAGFLIRLGDVAALNVGAAYLRGGRANYFDRSQTAEWRIQFRGSGNFDPTNPNGEDLDLDFAGTPKRSATDMIQVNLGVTFMFGG